MEYEAPEILKKKKYDLKFDVYSFSILIFEILIDCVMYPKLWSGEMSEYNFMNKIINQGYRHKFSIPVKNSLGELIEEICSENSSDRQTFDEIFNKLTNKTSGGEDEEEKEEENFLHEDIDTEELKI